MITGLLDRRITIYKDENTRNEYGESIKNPVKMDEMWCNIKKISGGEQIINNRIIWVSTYTITINQCRTDIKGDCYIIDDLGLKYNILDYDPTKIETKYTCRRIEG